MEDQNTQRWSVSLQLIETKSSSGHYFAPEILRTFLCKLIDSETVKLYGLSVASLDVQKIDNAQA